MKVELRTSLRATGLLVVAVALLVAGFQIRSDKASAVTLSLTMLSTRRRNRSMAL